MPRKRMKKVFTSVVSLLFALSIGWFAVLPPTSAWFYQNLHDENEQFIFGILSLNQTYLGDADIDLPAAAKLEDSGDIRFDEALEIVTVDAVNNGTLPARVYLTVTANSGNLTGLHYFFYFDDDTGATVKDKIAGKMTITDGNAASTYAALDAYNTGSGYAGGQGRYIVVPPGTTKVLKIAFWADYNTVGAPLENTGNVTVYNTYDVHMVLTAGQNTDGWFTR